VVFDLVDTLVKDDVPVFTGLRSSIPRTTGTGLGPHSLAVGERAVIKINDQMVKGQPLAFMDRDRPRQLDRKLLETTDNILDDLLFVFIVPVFDLLPSRRLDGVGPIADPDLDRVFVKLDHFSDTAIHPALFGVMRIIRTCAPFL